MVARINDALEANGFPREDRPAKLAEIIYRSLALRYTKVFEGLSLCTGKSIERVCIVGGGVKNEALNRLTALASGLEVVRGSSESTLLGNVAVQIGAIENTRSLEQIQQIASQLAFQGELPNLTH
jgi:rhamnulokinase